MNIKTFEVDKDELSTTRVVTRATSDIHDGDVLCKIDRFALTANNITYGVVGEKIGYWRFFPADDNWGIIPVWGFANVVESKHLEIKAGESLYGYFPTASHLVVRPANIGDTRLVDGAAHRAELPPVYNSYARTNAERQYDKSMDDERMLLFPLYATSYCLFDFLQDNDYFGASQVLVTSASSKTAIGLAYALADETKRLSKIGLTSAGNLDRVSKLSLYDDVVCYDTLDAIDSDKPTVIVDMSGNGTLLSNLHARLRDNMRYTTNVGLTHVGANEMGPDFISERSHMFFAPAHIQKRAQDWGPGEFEKLAMAFWYAASIKSRNWLHLDVHSGFDALSAIYQQVLSGGLAPDHGIIVSLAD